MLLIHTLRVLLNLGVTKLLMKVKCTYRRDRICGKGGGILLYVSNDQESNYWSTLNIHKFNGSIWCIVILHKNMKLLVAVCYRSPSSSEESHSELAELISKVLNEPHITHILIFGVFNYQNINWEHMTADLAYQSEFFYDNINENLLVQHINVILGTHWNIPHQD